MDEFQDEKIEYLLEPADILHFHSVFERRFGVLKYRELFLICLGGLSAALFIVWVFMNMRIISVFIVFMISFILFTIYALYGFIYVPVSLRMQARRRYSTGAEFPCARSVEFYSGIMRISRRYSRDTYDLAGFEYCGESRTHFCFFLNSEEAEGEVLPKSSFTQQQSEQLSKELSEFFGKRYFKV